MKYESSPVYPVDVVIIGAGPVGLAAALWFGQKNYQVVVVEQYGGPSLGLSALSALPPGQKTFNQRHQQVGLDPTSLSFLQDINKQVIEEIKKQGCPHDDWINISIFRLQNILYKAITKHDNVTWLFNAKINAVMIPKTTNNARLVITQEKGQIESEVYVFSPELVVICDGRHDGTGTSKTMFGFPPASRVTLSSLGVIGMIQRPDHPGTTCLNNYSSDCYQTSIGPMHVRLLGSLQERYIALGAADDKVCANLEKLSSKEIHDLLEATYDELKDKREPDFNGFTEVSKVPIQIVLDYRKETIKLLEGSNTIVTVEGDAARKTTFFSGSGLNSGYKGLDRLFSFCQTHADLIFRNTNLLHIDPILLEKDRESLEVSLELLKKGLKFILTPHHERSCTANHNDVRKKRSATSL